VDSCSAAPVAAKRDRLVRNELPVERQPEIRAVVPDRRARGLVDLVDLMCDSDGEAERSGFPIEEPVAKIAGDPLPGQLASIVEAGNAVDVVSGKGAPQLDANVLVGYEFQFKLFVARAVSPALYAKASGGLALKFALADSASVGANHEGKRMLGIDAFGANAVRRQHGETRKRRSDCCCADTCTEEHPDSAGVVGVNGKRQRR
jgi:hypothetical protein